MPFRTRKDGTVSDNIRKRPPICHSDRSVSGVEESTQVEKIAYGKVKEATLEDTSAPHHFIKAVSLFFDW